MVDRIKDVENEVLKLVEKPDKFVRIAASELYKEDEIFRFRVDIWAEYLSPEQESDFINQRIVQSYFLHVVWFETKIKILRSWPVLKKHELADKSAER